VPSLLQDSSQPGGCGKCLLVRNPAAVNSAWTAVVMKKNRCPPWATGCDSNSAHIDVAVPGYDDLDYSTANICGDADKDPTYMARDGESNACGKWYNNQASTAPGVCCDAIQDNTAGGAMLKKGCQLFSTWGWHNGNPQDMQYQAVECPAAFVALVGAAFDERGVVFSAPTLSPTNPGETWAPTPAPTPAPTLAPTPLPTPSPTNLGETLPPTQTQQWRCSSTWCDQAQANCEGGEGTCESDWANGLCDLGEWCDASSVNCLGECSGSAYVVRPPTPPTSLAPAAPTYAPAPTAPPPVNVPFGSHLDGQYIDGTLFPSEGQTTGRQKV